MFSCFKVICLQICCMWEQLTLPLPKAFANNADSEETARNELSLLKSALFATCTLNFTTVPVELKIGVVQFSTWKSRRLCNIRQ